MSCVPNTRFDHIAILSSVKGSESFQFSYTEHELIYKLTFIVYSCRNHGLYQNPFRFFSAVELSC